MAKGQEWLATGDGTLRRPGMSRAVADGFVLGTTEPLFYWENGVQADDGPFMPPMASASDQGIAGVKPGVTRSNYSGTINWSTPQILESKNFSGAAADSLRNITGTGHRIRNCLNIGPSTQQWPASGGGWMHAYDASCSDIVFEHVTVRPLYPNDRWDAFYGHDFTTYRCLGYRVVDGIGTNNPTGGPANVTDQGSWWGPFSWFNDDRGAHSDGTHNDGIQRHTGANVLMEGSVFWGYKWNALNGANDAGGTTPLAWDQGWASNRNPHAGQGILHSNVLTSHIDNSVYRNLWFYGWQHPIKVTAYCGVSGHGGHRYNSNPTIEDCTYMNDDQQDFGGTHKLYPIRTDGTDVQINGYTTSTWGNTPVTIPSAWNIRWANVSNADRKFNVTLARRGALVFGRI